MNKGGQSENTCLKYNNKYSKKLWKEKTTLLNILTKNYVSLFLYFEKAYKNERENKVTK